MIGQSQGGDSKFFCLEVSWGGAFPSFRRLKSRFYFVIILFISNSKRRNEGEGLFYETFRQKKFGNPECFCGVLPLFLRPPKRNVGPHPDPT